MNIRLLLIYLVLLSAVQQGPAAYRDLMSVGSEQGYAQKMFHYFSTTAIENVCPTPADLAWRIGNEVFCTLLCLLLSLLLRHAPSIAKSAKGKWSALVTTVHEWRNRPSRCRHCGTAPCPVKRRSLWKPSESRKRDKVNFAARSKAMMMFNYGLELSVVLTKGLPQDDLYLERKFCQRFEEEHMALFPLCIQRQINYWFPLPR
ncbi:uncharacterized protein LOC110460216 [Mizuhopecten yessoensis]|uniref:uncharacterized protein LOC110460216 n=1 Tax=Mizuhopecten yessoensis TaxID=6573 RepID=UPI000B45C6F0|nr:uncharacterized protein LOC110460216 [Mizuhopecten yessoensis]